MNKNNELDVSFSKKIMRYHIFEANTYADKSFYDTNLAYVLMKDVRLIDCNLDRIDASNGSFINTTFLRSSFSFSGFEGCKFKNCKFDECNSQAPDFSNSKFEETSIINSALIGCNINNCTFIDSSINKVNVKASGMFGNHFINSSLSEIDFAECASGNLIFDNTIFKNVIFSVHWLPTYLGIDINNMNGFEIVDINRKVLSGNELDMALRAEMKSALSANRFFEAINSARMIDEYDHSLLEKGIDFSLYNNDFRQLKQLLRSIAYSPSESQDFQSLLDRTTFKLKVKFEELGAEKRMMDIESFVPALVEYNKLVEIGDNNKTILPRNLNDSQFIVMSFEKGDLKSIFYFVETLEKLLDDMKHLLPADYNMTTAKLNSINSGSIKLSYELSVLYLVPLISILKDIFGIVYYDTGRRAKRSKKKRRSTKINTALVPLPETITLTIKFDKPPSKELKGKILRKVMNGKLKTMPERLTETLQIFRLSVTPEEKNILLKLCEKMYTDFPADVFLDLTSKGTVTVEVH